MFVSTVCRDVSGEGSVGVQIESKAIAKEAGVSTISGWVGVVEDTKTALKTALKRSSGFSAMCRFRMSKACD